MSKTRALLLERLSAGPRTDLSKEFSRASGVALLLFEGPDGLELLFIQRALNPLDNWSGQIAFPGGKRDPSDPTLLDTCLREVQEEIGLVLSPSDLLGSLDDIQARKKGHVIDFYVQPFVFWLSEKPKIMACASEVADAFWVPVAHLQSAENRVAFEFARDDLKLSLPSIRFPGGQTLWGLTHMMVMNFLSKCFDV